MLDDPQPTTAEAPPPSAPRRRTRSRRYKVVAGVCGGLGRHYGLDPVIFRVPLGVVSVIGGLGLIAYGFAWLLIPLEDEEENELRRLLSGRVESSSLTALLCAIVGCGLFLASLVSQVDAQIFSVQLAGSVVAAVYWSQHRRRGRAPDPDAPPEAQAPPVPAGPSWWQEQRPYAGTGPGPWGPHDTGYLWGPADLPADDSGTEYGHGPGSERGVEAADEPRAPLSPPRRLGTLVFPAALLAAAGGTAATWASQPLGTSLAIGLSSALAVLGVGLVVSAFAGRLGFGTVVAVVLTGALLTGAAALPKNISTTWAHAAWRPAAAAELRGHYALGTGQATLDLSRIAPEDGRTLRTSAELGAGELEVAVPNDVSVRIDLRIGIGHYQLPERPGEDGLPGVRSGGGADVEERFTLPPLTGERPRGTLELRLKVGVGQVRVVQRPPVRNRADGTLRDRLSSDLRELHGLRDPGGRYGLRDRRDLSDLSNLSDLPALREGGPADRDTPSVAGRQGDLPGVRS